MNKYLVPQKKLFVYADETGQHKRSNFFIVGLLIVENRDKAERWAKTLDACKKSLKWHNTKYENKIEFLRRLKETSFQFSSYVFIVEGDEKGKSYREPLVEGITRILKRQKAQRIFLYLDGENNKKANQKLSAHLRQHRIPVKKIRGLDDKKVPLIRIIDAIVGAVGDYKRRRGKKLENLIDELIKEGKIKN